jgi:hypothetical protein
MVGSGKRGDSEQKVRTRAKLIGREEVIYVIAAKPEIEKEGSTRVGSF